MVLPPENPVSACVIRECEIVIAYSRQEGGKPLKLAFCWAHGRDTLIAAKPQKGSPVVDEALLRIAALYKVEDSIRGSDPDRRRAGRQELSFPLVDEFFARAYCPSQTRVAQNRSGRGHGLYAEASGRLPRSGAYAAPLAPRSPSILDDGRVDMDSNLVENAIRSPAMNRPNALFAGHDEGGRNWARFASLIGTSKTRAVEPYAYLRDLLTKLANRHRDKDIHALMPWVYVPMRRP